MAHAAIRWSAEKDQTIRTMRASGALWNEIGAILGHSADAVVQGASTVWELTRQSMTEIEFEHPEIARCILHNLSLSLAERLRLTTVQLRLAAEG